MQYNCNNGIYTALEESWACQMYLRSPGFTT